MAILQNNVDEVYGPEGLISRTPRVIDITAPSVRYDLHDRARQALTANAAYLALAAPTNAQNTAQIKRLTRECSALIRLLIAVDGADDLLVESADV